MTASMARTVARRVVKDVTDRVTNVKAPVPAKLDGGWTTIIATPVSKASAFEFEFLV
jgi:hypothetical protein